jgi:hypothetical protein
MFADGEDVTAQVIDAQQWRNTTCNLADYFGHLYGRFFILPHTEIRQVGFCGGGSRISSFSLIYS